MKTVFATRSTPKTKIPPYASNFKKEYLFITELDREFSNFINHLHKLNDGLFESRLAYKIKYSIKDFLKRQNQGKFKEISNLILQRDEVNNLIFINEKLKMYNQRYLKLSYDSDENPYPGFKEFYDIFKVIFNQIKYEDRDSDDDSDIEEDYFVVLPDIEEDYFLELLNSFSDSDSSDSDSDD